MKQVIEFLNFFHLNGVNEKVVISTDEKTSFTKCRCINEDRTVITEIQLLSNLFQNETFGIYDVSQFKRFLTLVDENATFQFEKNQGVNSSLLIKSDKMSVKYNLTDLSVIPTPPDKLKKDPEYHFQVNLNKEAIKNIISALDVTKSQLVQFQVNDNGDLECIVGNIQYKENIVTIQLQGTRLQQPSANQINFNSSYFSNVLSSAGEGILKISMDGLYLYTGSTQNLEFTYLQKSMVLN